MQPNTNNGQEEPKLETVVSEVTAMKTRPVATEASKENVVFTDKPKKNHGMFYRMIVLAILAIGGIGFGVWAMMDGNQQKNQLNSQISALKSQNSELQEKIDKQSEALKPEFQEGDNEEKKESDDTSSASESMATTEDNVDRYSWSNDSDVRVDYIYVGGWGIRIKIPESLSSGITYSFGDGDYLEVFDTGGIIGYGIHVNSWDNVNILKITRSKSGTIDFDGCMASCSTYITTIGGYDYSYMMQGNNLELLQSTPLHEMVKKEAFSTF